MHVNITSLARNFEGLSHIVNNFKDLKVIGISESRIKKENLHSSNLEIPGYSMLFHPTEAAAGGTVLCISDSLAFKPREDLSSFAYKPKLLESTFIEIECKKKANIIVECVYKHPVMQTRDFNKNILETIFDKINREGKRLVLLGDFNINLLAYKENKEVKEFVDILQNNLITPTINLPTRITAQSSTTIDNILMSSFNSKVYSGNL